MDDEVKVRNLKTLGGFLSYQIAGLYFGPPFGVFLTAGGRGEITLIRDDPPNYTVLGKKKDHTLDCNEIIMWNESKGSFLSCSFDKRVLLYSLRKDDKNGKISLVMEKEVFRSKFRIQRLLKLTEDLFISVSEVREGGYSARKNNLHELSLISLSKCQRLRIIEEKTSTPPRLISVGWWSRPRISMKYPHCLYIACCHHGESRGITTKNFVCLLDYENDIVIREFHQGLSTYSGVYGIEVFTSRSGKEILCAVHSCPQSSHSTIFVHDCSINDINKNLIRKVKLDEHPRTVTSFSSSRERKMIGEGFNYLMYGSSEAGVGLFHVDIESCDLKRLFLHKCEGTECVYHITPIRSNLNGSEKEENKLRLMCGFFNSEVQVIEIQNLKLHSIEDETANFDLKERIEFVVEDMGKLMYVDDEKRRLKNVFCVKYQFSDIYCPRILFLL